MAYQKTIGHSLIVASNLVTACNTASKWGWEQTGDSVFKKLDGERVVFVRENQRRLFYGCERGTKIYMGQGWNQRSDKGEIEMLIQQERFVRVDTP